jgi:hypothetical protein
MKWDLQRVVQQAMKDAFCVKGVVCRFENDSQILSPQQHSQILSCLPESSGGMQVKLELLYRASRDGWQGQDFHSRCDSKGATVTVIKCTGGFVFGGYADVSWHSRDGDSDKKSLRGKVIVSNYTQSAQSFLFSLNSPSSVGPVKLPLVLPPHEKSQHNAPHALTGNHPKAIVCNASHGPIFGGGPDLRVANCGPDLRFANRSYTNLRSTYQLLPGQSALSPTFFTGSHHFEAAEVEVYQVPDRQDCVSLHVPLESFKSVSLHVPLDQVFECVPDVRAPLLRALNSDKNYFDTQVEVLRGLFSGDKEEPPQWPSAEADIMLNNPPLLLVSVGDRQHH